jgi:CHAT domain-containing protein/Tfp pilus assembly protein PilF
MKIYLAILVAFAACYGQANSADNPTELDARQKQTIELYKAGVDRAEKTKGADSPEMAVALSRLAAAYKAQGKYGEAEPLYIRAVTIFEKTLGTQESAEVAFSIDNLATLYMAEGQYTKAEPMCIRALSILERTLGPEDPETAMSLNNLAFLYKSQGRYSKAEPLYLRALAIQEKKLGPDHADTVNSLNNLAVLYKTQGQYTKAEPLYLRALTTREKKLGDKDPNTALSLNTLAGLYVAEYQFAKAEPLFLRALNIDEKVLGPNAPATTVVLNNLAGLYLRQSQYAKAEPLYVRLLAIREEALGEDHPDTAASLNNLAELYRLQGEYAKAEALQVRALAIKEKTTGAEGPDAAISLNNLALIYQAEGKYSKAEDLMLHALTIDEKTRGAEDPALATSLSNLGALYVEQGRYAKAEPLYKRALSINEKALGAQHPNTTNARDNLVILQWEAGDSERARQTLAAGWPQRLRWIERSVQFGRDTLRRKWVEDLRREISLVFAVQGSDSHIHELGLQSLLVGKVRVLEETAAALDALRPRLEPELRSELSELNDLRVERATLLNAPNLKLNRSKLEELIDKEDKLVADLTRRSLEFRELAATPGIPELRKRLGSAALVEMVEFDELLARSRDGKRRGPPRYGAYMLTASGNVLWQDLGPAAAIDVLVRRYRYAISMPGNRGIAEEAAQQLDAKVFAPIRKALPQVKDFYISADGLLRLISFPALRDANGTPLIDNYTIQIVSTGRDLARGAPVRSSQPAWVGGLSEFGQLGKGLFFPAIPGAKDEAHEVAKIIRPRPQELNDSQLTKQFLTQQMDGPRILHLATHGYYSGQTAGLALKDANVGSENILNQEEVAGLRLQGTQLVVLSACETALGEVSFADGVVGLQRSLTLAGARSQILTLWPVNDAKTKDLMVAFYRNLFEKKMTKSEGLRQAQLEMVHQGVDPYYWAAFVLYGDGGPLGD